MPLRKNPKESKESKESKIFGGPAPSEKPEVDQQGIDERMAEMRALAAGGQLSLDAARDYAHLHFRGTQTQRRRADLLAKNPFRQSSGSAPSRPASNPQQTAAAKNVPGR